MDWPGRQPLNDKDQPMSLLRSRGRRLALAALLVLAAGYAFALARYGSPGEQYRAARLRLAEEIFWNNGAGWRPTRWAPAWLVNWAGDVVTEHLPKPRIYFVSQLPPGVRAG